MCIARFLGFPGHDKLTFADVKMVCSNVMSGPGLFQKARLGFILPCLIFVSVYQNRALHNLKFYQNENECEENTERDRC